MGRDTAASNKPLIVQRQDRADTYVNKDPSIRPIQPAKGTVTRAAVTMAAAAQEDRGNDGLHCESCSGGRQRAEQGTVTLTKGPELHVQCVDIQYALYEWGHTLEHLSVLCQGGTNGEELWVRLIKVGEQLAQIIDWEVTDIMRMQAGDRKIKRRSPYLWKYHTAYDNIEWKGQPYEGVQDAQAIADQGWETQKALQEDKQQRWRKKRRDRRDGRRWSWRQRNMRGPSCEGSTPTILTI